MVDRYGPPRLGTTGAAFISILTLFFLFILISGFDTLKERLGFTTKSSLQAQVATLQLQVEQVLAENARLVALLEAQQVRHEQEQLSLRRYYASDYAIRQQALTIDHKRLAEIRAIMAEPEPFELVLPAPRAPTAEPPPTLQPASHPVAEPVTIPVPPPATRPTTPAQISSAKTNQISRTQITHLWEVYCELYTSQCQG